MYKKVNHSDARKPNFQLIAVRWNYVNIGDKVGKKYMSRPGSLEFRQKGGTLNKEDWFAGTNTSGGIASV